MNTKGVGLAWNAAASRRRPAQDRHSGPAHTGDQVCAGRIDPSVRVRQQSDQGRWIVVEPVKGDPGHTPILGTRPLPQKGRLAVAGRRRHPHDAAVARTSSPDQLGAIDDSSATLRNRKLGVEQQPAEIRSCREHVGPVLGHAKP